ncbi:flagellar basal-body MS-ring/collar protein FliF [Inconstantimicrobium porci]|uniref:Flagellar M-ring protein n=1 Tax=Inconstantimicrobium porci TaxID=2652291 RepID=A0A7X2MXV3_9CLOT|nr:flagellar basal-body MS-ring/collar protein FliF [Inconstantimicrobium porci]MSR91073.1 flagellar basal body M-ring protein FliF [Inconstantimicrobium porci]
MDKLKEKMKAIWDKVKALKKPVKIVLIVAISALIIGIVSLIISSSKNKYSVLFSNLEDKDAQTVVSKLKSDKIDYKVEGNKILVPTSSVSELRLQLAPEITGGSSGYELMDSQSSFGMTDEEFKIKKQRMLEGELEKSIKSFSEVETARVHITEANDSVFVTDKTPGKAAVTIKLKDGKELTKNQVKSIMSLVSGATKNIPKSNVEVVDDKMKLLSQGLYTENSDGTSTAEVADSESVDKQRVLETNYESKLEKSINELLEPVLGKDKIKAKVNVDLDFDSTQKTVVTPDPNKVIKSQKTIRDKNNAGTTSTTESPVDNNMSNTINDTNANNGNSQRDEQDTQYEVGKTEIKTISAPGEVKRVTASVVVDGTLDQTTTQAIQDLVSSAIGYKQERGDQISVAGMAFDQSAKEELKKQVEQMNADEEKAKKTRLYTILGIVGAVLLILIIGTVIFLVKKNKNEEDEYEEEMESTIDTVIGDDLEKEKAKFKSIDFDNDTEESHVEEEIKKYAKEKPDQVVDVIKSWLNESER